MFRWKALQFCWTWSRNETSKRHWKDRKRSVTGQLVQAACKKAYLRVTLNLWQPMTSVFPNEFILLSDYSLPKLNRNILLQWRVSKSCKRVVLFITKSFHSKVIPQCNIFSLDSNIKTPGHCTHKRAVKSRLLEQMKGLSFDYSVMLQTYKLLQCFVYILVSYILQPFMVSRAVK